MKRSARSISLATRSYRRPSVDDATNCWFQAWTWERSANPPLAKARSRFSVDADWWYAVTSRVGSGRRASGSKVSSFTMWPRNESSSTSPILSVGDDRGLANWPAIRPTLTTGTPAA